MNICVTVVKNFLLRNMGESYIYDFPVYVRIPVGGKRPDGWPAQATRTYGLAEAVNAVAFFGEEEIDHHRDPIKFIFRKYIGPKVTEWGQPEKTIEVVKVHLNNLPIVVGDPKYGPTTEEIILAAERIGLEVLPDEIICAIAQIIKKNPFKSLRPDFRKLEPQSDAWAPRRKRYEVGDRDYDLIINTDTGEVSANPYRVHVETLLFAKKEKV